jgi:hypothetical protein
LEPFGPLDTATVIAQQLSSRYSDVPIPPGSISDSKILNLLNPGSQGVEDSFSIYSYEVCTPNTTEADLHTFFTTQLHTNGWTVSPIFPYDGVYPEACHDAPYCWTKPTSQLDQTPRFIALDIIIAAGQVVRYNLHLTTNLGGAACTREFNGASSYLSFIPNTDIPLPPLTKLHLDIVPYTTDFTSYDACTPQATSSPFRPYGAGDFYGFTNGSSYMTSHGWMSASLSGSRPCGGAHPSSPPPGDALVYLRGDEVVVVNFSDATYTEPGALPTWTIAYCILPGPPPVVVHFKVTPTSFAQACTSPTDPLPALALTLDNTGSTIGVGYQVTIIGTAPNGREPWASARPTAGTVAAGKQAQLTIAPATDLCSQLVGTSPYTFTASIQPISAGRGTTIVTDSVTPFHIG